MFRASQFWLIHQINDNPLYLGYVGAAAAVPGIVFNLFGGVFADKVDKRRLIMATQVALGSLAGEPWTVEDLLRSALQAS